WSNNKPRYGIQFAASAHDWLWHDSDETQCRECPLLEEADIGMLSAWSQRYPTARKPAAACLPTGELLRAHTRVPGVWPRRRFGQRTGCRAAGLRNRKTTGPTSRSSHICCAATYRRRNRAGAPPTLGKKIFSGPAFRS